MGLEKGGHRGQCTGGIRDGGVSGPPGAATCGLVSDLAIPGGDRKASGGGAVPWTCMYKWREGKWEGTNSGARQKQERPERPVFQAIGAL